ncbi:MAG: DUF4339 domain-containing protein [Lentisphaerae bacterium]|nr:DUF4339 domain-containing protein [Lentisphaerota bacterium]
MPVNFECDKCGNKIEISGKNIGSTIKCPGCQTDILVPNPNMISQVIEIRAPDPLPNGDGKYHTNTFTGTVEWYYAAGSKQVGPVDEYIMRQLVDSRTVTNSTMVWRQGMDDWLPASETELILPLKTPLSYSSNQIAVKKTTKNSPLKYMITGGVIVFVILWYIGNIYQKQNSLTDQSTQSRQAQSSLYNKTWTTIFDNGNCAILKYSDLGTFEVLLSSGNDIYAYSGRFKINENDINHIVDTTNIPGAYPGNKYSYSVLSLAGDALQVRQENGNIMTFSVYVDKR